jgi:hypothetical protein
MTQNRRLGYAKGRGAGRDTGQDGVLTQVVGRDDMTYGYV